MSGKKDLIVSTKPHAPPLGADPARMTHSLCNHPTPCVVGSLTMGSQAALCFNIPKTNRQLLKCKFSPLRSMTMHARANVPCQVL
jgi:hypothetical protein